MLFVDEFCGILVYIKFGADVTSQYEDESILISLIDSPNVAIVKIDDIQKMELSPLD